MAELLVAHLADDAGLVRKGDMLAFLHDARISSAPEPTARAPVGVAGLSARLPGLLARRLAMPVWDAEYKKGLAALF